MYVMIKKDCLDAHSQDKLFQQRTSVFAQSSQDLSAKAYRTMFEKYRFEQTRYQPHKTAKDFHNSLQAASKDKK